MMPKLLKNIALGLCIANANAFIPSSSKTVKPKPPPGTISTISTVTTSTQTITTSHFSSKGDASRSLIAKNSYAEQSRKYRRTVYTADDWVKHRDPDRFLRNLSTIFQSGIITQLFKEVWAVTSIAIFIDLWNVLLVDGYCDFGGNLHDPINQIADYWKLALPMGPFSISSSALGLLLVFRTNSSYSRWWEARGCWGKIINHSRNIMRMGSSWTLKGATTDNREQRIENVQALAIAVWEFPRALTRHLLSEEEDEAQFAAQMYERLTKEQAQAIINCRHRPTKALFDLSCAVDSLGLPYVKRIEVDKSIVVLCDQAGACERIFSSPVPLVYTRHTARFLSLWLLLLPFALYGPFNGTWNHIGMIPCAAAVSFFFFGIEELAVTLEEPFSILPMHAMSNGINLSAQEYAQWHIDDDSKYVEEK